MAEAFNSVELPQDKAARYAAPKGELRPDRPGPIQCVSGSRVLIGDLALQVHPDCAPTGQRRPTSSDAEETSAQDVEAMRLYLVVWQGGRR